MLFIIYKAYLDTPELSRLLIWLIVKKKKKKKEKKRKKEKHYGMEIIIRKKQWMYDFVKSLSISWNFYFLTLL